MLPGTEELLFVPIGFLITKGLYSFIEVCLCGVVHTCTCMHADTHTHTHTHACMHTHMHTHTHTHTHTFMCAQTHMRTHTHMHVCTHTCMHTHTIKESEIKNQREKEVRDVVERDGGGGEENKQRERNRHLTVKTV